MAYARVGLAPAVICVLLCWLATCNGLQTEYNFCELYDVTGVPHLIMSGQPALDTNSLNLLGDLKLDESFAPIQGEYCGLARKEPSASTSALTSALTPMQANTVHALDPNDWTIEAWLKIHSSVRSGTTFNFLTMGLPSGSDVSSSACVTGLLTHRPTGFARAALDNLELETCYQKTGSVSLAASAAKMYPVHVVLAFNHTGLHVFVNGSRLTSVNTELWGPYKNSTVFQIFSNSSAFPSGVGELYYLAFHSGAFDSSKAIARFTARAGLRRRPPSITLPNFTLHDYDSVVFSKTQLTPTADLQITATLDVAGRHCFNLSSDQGLIPYGVPVALAEDGYFVITSIGAFSLCEDAVLSITLLASAFEAYNNSVTFAVSLQRRPMLMVQNVTEYGNNSVPLSNIVDVSGERWVHLVSIAGSAGLYSLNGTELSLPINVSVGLLNETFVTFRRDWNSSVFDTTHAQSLSSVLLKVRSEWINGTLSSVSEPCVEFHNWLAAPPSPQLEVTEGETVCLSFASGLVIDSLPGNGTLRAEIEGVLVEITETPIIVEGAMCYTAPVFMTNQTTSSDSFTFRALDPSSGVVSSAAFQMVSISRAFRTRAGLLALYTFEAAYPPPLYLPFPANRVFASAVPGGLGGLRSPNSTVYSLGSSTYGIVAGVDSLDCEHPLQSSDYTNGLTLELWYSVFSDAQALLVSVFPYSADILCSTPAIALHLNASGCFVTFNTDPCGTPSTSTYQLSMYRPGRTHIAVVIGGEDSGRNTSVYMNGTLAETIGQQSSLFAGSGDYLYRVAGDGDTRSVIELAAIYNTSLSFTQVHRHWLLRPEIRPAALSNFTLLLGESSSRGFVPHDSFVWHPFPHVLEIHSLDLVSCLLLNGHPAIGEHTISSTATLVITHVGFAHCPHNETTALFSVVARSQDGSRFSGPSYLTVATSRRSPRPPALTNITIVALRNESTPLWDTSGISLEPTVPNATHVVISNITDGNLQVIVEDKVLVDFPSAMSVAAASRVRMRYSPAYQQFENANQTGLLTSAYIYVAMQNEFGLSDAQKIWVDVYTWIEAPASLTFTVLPSQSTAVFPVLTELSDANESYDLVVLSLPNYVDLFLNASQPRATSVPLTSEQVQLSVNYSLLAQPCPATSMLYNDSFLAQVRHRHSGLLATTVTQILLNISYPSRLQTPQLQANNITIMSGQNMSLAALFNVLEPVACPDPVATYRFTSVDKSLVFYSGNSSSTLSVVTPASELPIVHIGYTALVNYTHMQPSPQIFATLSVSISFTSDYGVLSEQISAEISIVNPLSFLPVIDVQANEGQTQPVMNIAAKLSPYYGSEAIVALCLVDSPRYVDLLDADGASLHCASITTPLYVRVKPEAFRFASDTNARLEHVEYLLSSSEGRYFSPAFGALIFDVKRNTSISTPPEPLNTTITVTGIRNVSLCQVLSFNKSKGTPSSLNLRYSHGQQSATTIIYLSASSSSPVSLYPIPFTCTEDVYPLLSVRPIPSQVGLSPETTVVDHISVEASNFYGNSTPGSLTVIVLNPVRAKTNLSVTLFEAGSQSVIFEWDAEPAQTGIRPLVLSIPREVSLLDPAYSIDQNITALPYILSDRALAVYANPKQFAGIDGNEIHTSFPISFFDVDTDLYSSNLTWVFVTIVRNTSTSVAPSTSNLSLSLAGYSNHPLLSLVKLAPGSPPATSYTFTELPDDCYICNITNHCQRSDTLHTFSSVELESMFLSIRPMFAVPTYLFPSVRVLLYHASNEFGTSAIASTVNVSVSKWLSPPHSTAWTVTRGHSKAISLPLGSVALTTPGALSIRILELPPDATLVDPGTGAAVTNVPFQLSGESVAVTAWATSNQTVFFNYQCIHTPSNLTYHPPTQVALTIEVPSVPDAPQPLTVNLIGYSAITVAALLRMTGPLPDDMYFLLQNVPSGCKVECPGKPSTLGPFNTTVLANETGICTFTCLPQDSGTIGDGPIAAATFEYGVGNKFGSSSFTPIVITIYSWLSAPEDQTTLISASLGHTSINLPLGQVSASVPSTTLLAELLSIPSEGTVYDLMTTTIISSDMLPLKVTSHSLGWNFTAPSVAGRNLTLSYRIHDSTRNFTTQRQVTLTLQVSAWVPLGKNLTLAGLGYSRIHLNPLFAGAISHSSLCITSMCARCDLFVDGNLMSGVYPSCFDISNQALALAYMRPAYVGVVPGPQRFPSEHIQFYIKGEDFSSYYLSFAPETWLEGPANMSKEVSIMSNESYHLPLATDLSTTQPSSAIEYIVLSSTNSIILYDQGLELRSFPHTLSSALVRIVSSGLSKATSGTFTYISKHTATGIFAPSLSTLKVTVQHVEIPTNPTPSPNIIMQISIALDIPYAISILLIAIASLLVTVLVLLFILLCRRKLVLLMSVATHTSIDASTNGSNPPVPTSAREVDMIDLLKATTNIAQQTRGDRTREDLGSSEIHAACGTNVSGSAKTNNPDSCSKEAGFVPDGGVVSLSHQIFELDQYNEQLKSVLEYIKRTHSVPRVLGHDLLEYIDELLDSTVNYELPQLDVTTREAEETWELESSPSLEEKDAEEDSEVGDGPDMTVLYESGSGLEKENSVSRIIGPDINPNRSSLSLACIDEQASRSELAHVRTSVSSVVAELATLASAGNLAINVEEILRTAGNNEGVAELLPEDILEHMT